MSEQTRNLVVLIVALTLCIILVIAVLGAAFGVQLKELTRDAVIGAVGVLSGALVAYVAKK